MDACPGFVHRISPVLTEVFGVRLYYYGLAYALGFVGVLAWFSLRRRMLGWSRQDAWELSILFAGAVLVLGRGFAVAVYQWDYYSRHPTQLLHWWRGGMASHGVLLGGLAGPWVFCRLRKQPLLRVMDEVAIPGSVFLALGRIANFINGVIVGTVTDVWWGVKFPTAEGLRHPVTLYESAKNLLLVPILLLVRRRHRPGSGRLLAHFVFWYGFLRIFADLFRDHGKSFLGLGRNQYFNIVMAMVGLGMLLFWRPRVATPARPEIPLVPEARRARLWVYRVVFAGILFLSLTIPGAWTAGSLPRLQPDRPDAGNATTRPAIRVARPSQAQPEAISHLHRTDHLPCSPGLG